MTEAVVPAAVPAPAAPAAVPAVTTPTTPAIAAGIPSTPAVPAAVPTAVEYKFDAAEGVAAEFDASVVATAKALGWDLDTAKKFRDHEISLARAERDSDMKSMEAAKAAEVQRIAQEDAAWDRDNRAHPEFGGQRFDETSTKIDKLLMEYDKGGKLAEQIAQAPRLKSAPAFRAFLASLAHAHGEGRFVQGDTKAGNQSQAATLSEMYPSMVKR